VAKKGTPMTRESARRIQSSQDRKGRNADEGFKSRAMRAAEKNTKK